MFFKKEFESEAMYEYEVWSGYFCFAKRCYFILKRMGGGNKIFFLKIESVERKRN